MYKKIFESKIKQLLLLEEQQKQIDELNEQLIVLTDMLMFSESQLATLLKSTSV